MSRKLSFKQKIAISFFVDAMDFILSTPAIIGYLSGVGIPLTFVVNNIKGVIYDTLIAAPISLWLWGTNLKGLLPLGETVIPEEIDAFIPSVTIAGLLSRRKR